jgi:hypothetical protein
VKPAETEICIQAPSCGRSLDTTFQSFNLAQEAPLLLPLLQEQEQQEQPYQEPSYAWKITGYTDCTASCLGGRDFRAHIVLYNGTIQCTDCGMLGPVFADPIRIILPDPNLQPSSWIGIQIRIHLATP